MLKLVLAVAALSYAAPLAGELKVSDVALAAAPMKQVRSSNAG